MPAPFRPKNLMQNAHARARATIVHASVPRRKKSPLACLLLAMMNPIGHSNHLKGNAETGSSAGLGTAASNSGSVKKGDDHWCGIVSGRG